MMQTQTNRVITITIIVIIVKNMDHINFYCRDLIKLTITITVTIKLNYYYFKMLQARCFIYQTQYSNSEVSDDEVRLDYSLKIVVIPVNLNVINTNYIKFTNLYAD